MVVSVSELVVFGVFPGVPGVVGLVAVVLTPVGVVPDPGVVFPGVVVPDPGVVFPVVVVTDPGVVFPGVVAPDPVVVGFDPGTPVVTGVVIVPETTTVGLVLAVDPPETVVPSVTVVVSTVVAVVVTVTKQPKIWILRPLTGDLGALKVTTTSSTGLFFKSVIGLFFGASCFSSTGVPLKYVVTVNLPILGVSTWITPTRPTESGLNGILTVTSLAGKFFPDLVNKSVLS